MGTLGLDPSCGILQRSTFLLNTHIIGQHWYDQKKNIGHDVGSDTPVSTIKFKYFPMQKKYWPVKVNSNTKLFDTCLLSSQENIKDSKLNKEIKMIRIRN